MYMTGAEYSQYSGWAFEGVEHDSDSTILSKVGNGLDTTSGDIIVENSLLIKDVK